MDGVSTEKTKAVEELIQELAQERAENQKMKIMIDRYSSQIAQLKHSLNQMAEADERKNKEDNARESELINMRNEMKIIEFSKQFRKIGMSDKMAEETARAMLNRETEQFDKNIAAFIKEVKKGAEDAAIQKFLADRPETYAGNGNMEIEPAAVRFAKQYASRQVVDAGSLQRFE